MPTYQYDGSWKRVWMPLAISIVIRAEEATYALDVSISTTNMPFSKLQLGGGSPQSSTRTGQTIHIFSGNRLNQNDAAPIVVTASEDRADAHIVIRLVTSTPSAGRSPRNATVTR
jgi:hypothetical protein